jgi:hypothetical protein
MGKFRHGVRLAKCMHNTISIGIDYGRALNLVQSETNSSKKHEFEGRMRYIYSAEKRKAYAAIIDNNVKASSSGRNRSHLGNFKRHHFVLAGEAGHNDRRR